MFQSLLFSILLFISTQVYCQEYQVAFYSDFEPISYSKNRNPESPEFNQPLGYETDFLKAMEQIPDSQMTLSFQGVKEWNNIWLMPATHPKIDIALGGITREEHRFLNSKNEHVVIGTHKTVNFMQSLLMRTKDSKSIKGHEDLTCAYTVGAVRGTTGEYRYLAQTNIVDNIDSGNLKKGITVVLEDKQHFTSDGTLSIYNPKIATRAMLLPPDSSLPITKYFVAEDSMIPALNEGFIDAIARGYIGNKLVADRSNGLYEVKAIYSLECPRQESKTCTKKEQAVLFVKVENTALLEKLNKYIDYLTDNGKIDYDNWRTNPHVFMERAKNYPKSEK